MDIEKLKSIIRLANNNPNENEANLAARKACKLIAEEDFKVLSGKPTTWNDVQRSTEPAWRSSPTGRYADPFDWMRDVINREAKAKEARYASNYGGGYGNPYPNEPKKEPEKPKTPPKPGHNWRANPNPEAEYGYHYYDEADDIFGDMFSGFGPRKRQPRKPGTNYGERLRKCSQCGKEVLTKRITNTFRCNDCEASDFINHPKQPKKKVHQVINCKTCRTAINRYVAEIDSWQCLCGASKITAREAASRGIKFT